MKTLYEIVVALALMALFVTAVGCGDDDPVELTDAAPEMGMLDAGATDVPLWDSEAAVDPPTDAVAEVAEEAGVDALVLTDLDVTDGDVPESD